MGTNSRYSLAGWLMLVLACVGAGGMAAIQPAETQPAQTQPAPAEQTTQTQPAAAVSPEPEIKPRFELLVPSVRTLLEQAVRSNSGALATPLWNMLLEMGTASSEGMDTEQAVALLEQIKTWPDTSLRGATYAPDTEGRPRWIIRFDWPLEALRGRVSTLLESEAGETILEGVSLRAAGSDGGYEIALAETTLAHLLPADESHACLASHSDLEMPQESLGNQAESPPLLACRLNLGPTEKDSGATSFSAFRAVTAIEYQARIDEQGDWTERVEALWPPISGMGAKAIFGKVKRTFWVPDSAFGALVFNSGLAAGMLDGMAGFGPQVMMEASGEFEIIGEADLGPIAKRTGSQACVTLLPGNGFLPVPDVVIQLITKRPDKLVEDIRAATEKMNKAFADREQPEPWHEDEVQGRAIFWSDGGSQFRGGMMPVVLRPVLFVAKEQDARQRERDILVLAWTSTSPEDLARRWLSLPRHKESRHLPSGRKTNGQLWINWSRAYKWFSPYLNITLSSMGVETLLPRLEEIRDNLTDAEVTAKLKYSGLRVSHRGPLPVGALLVPTLLAVSVAPDEGGGSDLARERLASQRLRVLYHHCKLFRKDLDRWPAEIAELDGYIDFAGHPELLRLRLSSKKRWSDWLEGVIEPEEPETDQEDEEEDEETFGYDTDLYVIEWGRDRWTLGYEPGTFEHLDRLCIDQDGDIHRVEKRISADSKEEQDRESTVTETTTPSEGANAEE